jgi:hypothetical protein
MRTWKRLFPILILALLAYLYFDERRFINRARPDGFSTEAPAGSVFAVRLQHGLELGKMRVGQRVRFLPAKALPYGSTVAATLPADAVIEARVRQVLSSPGGHRIVILEFERLRASRRVVPFSASLIVKNRAQIEPLEFRRETRGTLGAIIARIARGNFLVVIAGYLAGTYMGDFLSRRTDAPCSFFSSELGQTVPTSIEMQVQLHRRAYIPR